MSSIEGKDHVNCEQIEKIGEAVQQKLDGQCFNNISFKRADCAITLVNLQKGIRIENESIYIQPAGLFSRLLTLVDRSDNMEVYFEYELYKNLPPYSKINL